LQEVPDMKLRPPRDTREVFQMLAFFDLARGVNSILEQFDFGRTVPAQLQRIVLGTVPPGERAPADAEPAEYFRQLLTSEEFRRGVVRNFLNAFPEKARLLFVHIPKCAGSDLAANLSRRYWPVVGTMDNPHWMTIEQRLNYLREQVLAVPFVDSFLLRGHVRLRYYVNQGLIRPGDQIFTIVRNPVDLVVSAINYRLTRLSNDPTGKTPDTRMWLGEMGIKQFPADASDEDLVAFGRRMLRMPRVVGSNTLCNALGNGDAASALDNIAASDIEITDITRYEAWLRDRWAITSSARANTSRKYLTTATLAPAERALIEEKTQEDQVLFAQLTRQLDACGRSSLFGREIA
jgi:hypothetical protein